jgi:hypothetical protein
VFAELMPEALEQVRPCSSADELPVMPVMPLSCCAGCGDCGHHANDRRSCSGHLHDHVQVAAYPARQHSVLPMPARAN